ncbi:prolyl endopeptidase-like [Halichondria panicea]|uniref:prolyl endopeptidase-like n=1 Tax=Halichondria panicea TaxID=6063 RepID=UPI00312B8B86
MAKNYPCPRRDESLGETHFGTSVPDPYRWLEDPDSEETQGFVKAQNEISQPYLASCPVRNKFHARMTDLYNYPKYSAPFKRGTRYFYRYNTGLQNQSVYYVQSSLEAEAEVFLDPNLLSDDGTVALSMSQFSEDGELFAYGLSESGSDWNTIKVMQVSTKENQGDELKWVKFSSIAWTHDNKGFFYQRYPEVVTESEGTETTQVLDHKVYYHVVGSPQSEDALCYQDLEHRDWLFSVEVSDCGRYVILYVSRGAEPRNKLYYSDLEQLPGQQITGPLNMEKLIDDFDASWDFICNHGTVFTFKTDFEAPRYRLVNIDITQPTKDSWVTLVSEHPKDVLEWAACVNTTKLVLCYLSDVKSILSLYSLQDGSFIKNFPLEVGSVTSFSGRFKDTEIFYSFMSFLTPGVIYHCDLTQDELNPTVFREIKVEGFDASQYTTKQIFYPSKDGTNIPMFIVHKKDLTLDGTHPTLLYGYGGFNISITPSFSTSRLIFIQHLGGVFAIANIRGGGEYGDQWHKGGMMGCKQNVFDDFIAAGEYLIANGYTSTNKLTIMGGSNGGLLVCACANQRPDLFKCVISQVGVLDMLRFHKFTIGHAWVTDFGNPDKEDGFGWIYKYSPVHNISVPPENQQYPAMLLLTADHDDRVVPLHSFKYMAQLHHLMRGVAKQTNPLMIRIETKAGHGAGKPTSKVIDETADIYGFVAETVGAVWT